MIEQTINNSLLLAHPLGGDDFFSASIVWIIDHQSSGSMGFMLNKPAEISLERLLPKAPAILHEKRVLMGGPVHTDRLFFLTITDVGGRQANVDLTENLEDAINCVLNATATVIPMVGYAGWSSGQLEDEIRRDVWLLTQPNLLDLLEQDCEHRYPAAQAGLGFDPLLMTSSRSDYQ